jgi:fructose-specific component phosphotransferase system IIB-like protein
MKVDERTQADAVLDRLANSTKLVGRFIAVVDAEKEQPAPDMILALAMTLVFVCEKTGNTRSTPGAAEEAVRVARTALEALNAIPRPA